MGQCIRVRRGDELSLSLPWEAGAKGPFPGTLPAGTLLLGFRPPALRERNACCVSHWPVTCCYSS